MRAYCNLASDRLSALTIAFVIVSAMTQGWAWAEVPTDPPTFSDPLTIDNPFHPFQPNGTKVFTGRDEGSSTIFLDLYLTDTREFDWNGGTVECHILREVAFENGVLLEVSDNYFAQADDGTVYYFGEVVDNYVDGEIDNHDGSWLVGGPTLPTDPPETAVAIDPTIFMPVNPEVGDVFKPEDLFPVVDETAEVLFVDRKVSVPAGRYEGAIVIQETTQLSTATEFKWYAPGVGVVKVMAKREILELEASTLVQSPSSALRRAAPVVKNVTAKSAPATPQRTSPRAGR